MSTVLFKLTLNLCKYGVRFQLPFFQHTHTHTHIPWRHTEGAELKVTR